MKKKFDAVYTEKYTDRTTGEERKKYTNVGAVFERDDGSMCMAFLGSWINFYEPKAKAKDYQQAKEIVQNTEIESGAIEDEIPF